MIQDQHPVRAQFPDSVDCQIRAIYNTAGPSYTVNTEATTPGCSIAHTATGRAAVTFPNTIPSNFQWLGAGVDNKSATATDMLTCNPRDVNEAAGTFELVMIDSATPSLKAPQNGAIVFVNFRLGTI